jgi:hypothetical protein
VRTAPTIARRKTTSLGKFASGSGTSRRAELFHSGGGRLQQSRESLATQTGPKTDHLFGQNAWIMGEEPPIL